MVDCQVASVSAITSHAQGLEIIPLSASVSWRTSALVLISTSSPKCRWARFHPFCGGNEELKAFVHDIEQACLKKGNVYGRYSFGGKD
ncbi:hypothetical protein V6N13_053661 [Hibiscus sabdariffa]